MSLSAKRRPLDALAPADLLAKSLVPSRDRSFLLDPLFSRMNPEVLRNIFETEIEYCLKSCKSFAALPKEKQLHTQRRLCIGQIQRCWDTFSPHLRKELTDVRFIEMAEQLMEIDGFHNVSKEFCFQRYLDVHRDKINKDEPTDIHISMAIEEEGMARQDDTGFLVSVESLCLRSRFGIHYSDFISLIQADPTLRDVDTVRQIREVLQFLMRIVEECAVIQPAFPLVYAGTRKIKAICDHLCLYGHHDKAIEALLYNVLCLELGIDFISAEYLSWRVDNYLAAYECYVHMKALAEAETYIKRALTKVEEVMAFEQEAAGDDGVDPLKQRIMEAQLHRLNSVLFACELRSYAVGHRIINPNTVKESLVPEESSTKGPAGRRGSMMRADSTSWFQNPTHDKDYLLQMAAAAPLRLGVLPKDSFLRRTKAHARDEQVRSKTGTPRDITGTMPELPLITREGLISPTRIRLGLLSRHQHILVPPTPSRLHTAGVSRPTTTASEAIRIIHSLESHRFVEGAKKIAESRRNSIAAPPLPASTLRSRESSVVPPLRARSPGAGRVQPRALDRRPSSAGKSVASFSTRVVFKPIKRPGAHDENKPAIDDFVRIDLTRSVFAMLYAFSGDHDRFHAIVDGLIAIGPNTPRPLSSDKVSGPTPTHDFLRNFLCDLGFDLLVRDEGFFLSESHTADINVVDLKLGDKPTPERVAHLIGTKRFSHLSSVDIVKFARKLFDYGLWDRYTVVSNVAIETFKTHDDKTTSEEEILCFSKELTLRQKMVDFHQAFKKAQKTLTKDEIKDGLDVMFPHGSTVHQTLVALLNSISDCLDTEELRRSNCALLVSAAHALWDFVQPSLANISFISDTIPYRLQVDSTLVMVLQVVHIVMDEFPMEDTLFGIGASAKLGLVMEIIGEYFFASEVYKTTCDRITISRQMIGEGANSILSITCNVGYYPSAMESGYELPDFKFSPDFEDMTSAAVMRHALARMEVDCLAALFRCMLKHQHAAAEETRARKEEEYFRLTRKKLPPMKMILLPSDPQWDRLCGEDSCRRALLCTVYAGFNPGLSEQERYEFLDQATAHLEKSHKYEGRLLAFALKRVPYETPQKGFGAPLFVRRSPTTITVAPAPIYGAKGEVVRPHFYQVFCKKHSLSKVTFNDVEYLGTGTLIRHQDNVEMTIGGLIPNEKYVIAIAAYDEHGRILECGMSASSVGFVSAFPLPLSLIWSYISEIAHSLHYRKVADKAYRGLCTFFVDSPPSDVHLRITNPDVQRGMVIPKPASLRAYNADTSSLPQLSTFAQAIFSAVERVFEDENTKVFTDSLGSQPLLQSHLLRLQCIQALSLALNTSQLVQDPGVSVNACIAILEHMHPLLRLGIAVPFMAKVLQQTHSALLKSISIFDSAGGSAITSHLAPVTMYLLKLLVQFNDTPTALTIARSTATLIQTLYPILDTKILNSTATENTWLGFSDKMKRIYYARMKISIFAEYVYHMITSLTGDVEKGYKTDRQRLERFVEYLEVFIVRHSEQIKHVGPERRQLETNTSMKDLYAVMSCTSAELVFQDVSRFRKNPRYIEMVCRLVSFYMESTPDTALRIINETFEWMDRRHKALGQSELFSDERKLENIKRKKKNLFTDKAIALQASLKLLASRFAKYRKKKHAGGSVENLTHAPGTARPRMDSAASGAASPLPGAVSDDESRPNTAMRFTPEPEASAPMQVAPPKFRSLTPPARTTRTEANEFSIQARAKSPKTGATTQAPGKSSKEPAKVHVSRKQRAVHRAAYIAALPSVIRDTVKRALRTLDNDLSAHWQRARMLRRLRVIIHAEGPWRSHLSLLHGINLYQGLDKEFVYRDILGHNVSTFENDPNHGFDTEWLEGRSVGQLMMTSFRISQGKKDGHHQHEHRRSSSVTSNSGPTTYQGAPAGHAQAHEQLKAAPEMIQAFLQSVVLAARVSSWNQVIEGCRYLWKAIGFLRKTFIIANENWCIYLWRAYYVASLALMDMLKAVKVTTSVSEESTDQSHHGPSLPLKSLWELESSVFIASWRDKYQDKQTTILDLKWVAQFCFFALETLANARRWHRMLDFAEKVDGLFNHLYSPLLESLTSKARDNVFGRVTPKTSDLNQDPRSLDLYTLWLRARTGHMSMLLSELKNIPAPPEQLHQSQSQYDVLIQSAQAQAHPLSHAQICNEYGDFLYHHNQLDLATLFWSKALDALFGVDRMVAKWKAVLASLKTSEGLLTAAGGVRGCVLAAYITLKLARFSYITSHEKRAQLSSLATDMLTAPLVCSLEHPIQPLSYSMHAIQTLYPTTILFGDKFAMSPTQLIDSLLFLVNELIAAERCQRALQVSAIMEHIAVHVTDSSQCIGLAKLSLAKAYIGLGLYAEAVALLYAISHGQVLTPSDRRLHQQHAAQAYTSKMPLRPFKNDVDLNEEGNVSALKDVCTFRISEDLLPFYGKAFAADFDMTGFTLIMSVCSNALQGDSRQVIEEFIKEEMDDSLPSEYRDDKERDILLTLLSSVERPVRTVIERHQAYLHHADGPESTHTRAQLGLLYEMLGQIHHLRSEPTLALKAYHNACHVLSGVHLKALKHPKLAVDFSLRAWIRTRSRAVELMARFGLLKEALRASNAAMMECTKCQCKTGEFDFFTLSFTIQNAQGRLRELPEGDLKTLYKRVSDPSPASLRASIRCLETVGDILPNIQGNGKDEALRFYHKAEKLMARFEDGNIEPELLQSLYYPHYADAAVLLSKRSYLVEHTDISRLLQESIAKLETAISTGRSFLEPYSLYIGRVLCEMRDSFSEHSRDREYCLYQSRRCLLLGLNHAIARGGYEHAMIIKALQTLLNLHLEMSDSQNVIFTTTIQIAQAIRIRKSLLQWKAELDAERTPLEQPLPLSVLVEYSFRHTPGAKRAFHDWLSNSNENGPTLESLLNSSSVNLASVVQLVIDINDYLRDPEHILFDPRRQHLAQLQRELHTYLMSTPHYAQHCVFTGLPSLQESRVIPEAIACFQWITPFSHHVDYVSEEVYYDRGVMTGVFVSYIPAPASRAKSAPRSGSSGRYVIHSCNYSLEFIAEVNRRIEALERALQKYTMSGNATFQAQANAHYAELLDGISFKSTGVLGEMKGINPPPLTAAIVDTLQALFKTESGYLGSVEDPIMLWLQKIVIAFQQSQQEGTTEPEQRNSRAEAPSHID